MRFSRKIRIFSLVLTIAMIVCMFPSFEPIVRAATYEYDSGPVVITPNTHKDGDTIIITQGVYSVTIDSVDVNVIFGKYNPAGANEGVTIDRRNNTTTNALRKQLYEAGSELGWNRTNGGYYVPTAPFLITGDAKVNALFYGECVFYAGTNGVYVTQNGNRYNLNTESGNNWRRGGYAGIQVDGKASLTITNADNLSAYGAYLSNVDPSTSGTSPGGDCSDAGSAGGAGIGGGVSYNTVSSALAPGGNTAAYPSGYMAGTPGNITILNGNIYARGGHLAAGIGGGHNSAATMGSITLLGGNITAQGGAYAAGIGEGDSHHAATSPIFTETDYSIIIGGDTTKTLNVIAKGGYRAAGIGTTDELSHQVVRQSGLSIEIFNGNITATSGLGNAAAAAIGAGQDTDMQGNNITIHKDAVISAASFSSYAITNHGVMEDDLPVVNLDPNAYMYLARFTAYSNADRTFRLYAVMHTADDHAILVDRTAEQIKAGALSGAHYYAYDRTLDQYYDLGIGVVNPQSMDVDESAPMASPPGDSLTYFYDPSSIRTYTVPARYKAIALTLPDPSIYGGAYVLEAPNDRSNTQSTFSLIEKYNAGVASGRIEYQSDFHLTINNLGELVETPNMIEDAIADPLTDLRVGLIFDHSVDSGHEVNVVKDNLVSGFASTTYGYTVYVPSDTEKFFLDFKYAEKINDHTMSILVDTKRVLWRSGDISIDHHVAGVEDYQLDGDTYFFYEFGFRENTDRSEIWIRKTDHADVGTPTYVVYKVTVIKKHEHALYMDDPSKVYDGEGAQAHVTMMTEEPIGFVPTVTMLPSAIVITNHADDKGWAESANQVQPIFTNKEVSIPYHKADGSSGEENYLVSLKATRIQGSPVLEFITTIQCKGHDPAHIREVGTSLNLVTGRITHYGDTHSTIGHAAIDVGARGVNLEDADISNDTKGQAFVQIVCHGEEIPLWDFSFTQGVTCTLNDKNLPAARSAARERAEVFFAENTANRLRVYEETVTYLKGRQQVNTLITLNSLHLNGDVKSTEFHFYTADEVDINGKFSYSARISDGGEQHTLTDEIVNNVTYTYYVDANKDAHVDDSELVTALPGAPSKAGYYHVVASYKKTVNYEAYGTASFVIFPRELVVTGIENWLTRLDQAQLVALAGKTKLDIAANMVGEISFSNLIAGDRVQLNPNVSYYYNDVSIGYGLNKITLSLPIGQNWLPPSANPENLAAADRDNMNYVITSAVPDFEGINQLLTVPGELAYEIGHYLFQKNDGSPWDKYWPTWSTTPLAWNENPTMGEIPPSGLYINGNHDYHSPNNVTHRNPVTLRTVNKGATESRYSVDLEVGSMYFEFTKEVWDVNKYEYIAFEGGKWEGMDGVRNAIKITNHSNKPIAYEIQIEMDSFHGQGIEAVISTVKEPVNDTDPIITYAANPAASQGCLDYGVINYDASKLTADVSAYSVTRYLILGGVPQNPAAIGTGGTGTLTVTISPVTSP